MDTAVSSFFLETKRNSELNYMIYHLRMEAVNFWNAGFVLNTGDNGKSPCECWWYYLKPSSKIYTLQLNPVFS
jgi:hypothetical protein